MSNNMIECVIKRKGGSIHTMGHHAATQRHYQFKPEDPSNPLSPHVCAVDDEGDYVAFLTVKESFRRHVSTNKPVLSIPSQDESIQINLKDDINDLLSIDNPDTLTNAWLEKFSREILDIEINNKVELIDLASEYGLSFKKSNSPSTIVRGIVVEMIKEEKRGSAAYVSGIDTSDDQPSGNTDQSDDQGADNSTNDQSGNDNADD